ncbi:helix-turn-helix transcriptional regulator [Noviherbaspirillum sp.]|uniref:helix-turn-helix domain-containing protein n=1 Tax=Noviherbaspirillum sp. TaxID=1926288 RepID=UPI002B46BF4A|nr:helix-turn-helix transcriptional regulator [Noviherbaspirillum sp.]HJV82452.1 helix-turn-helix transcriptional regulator [Noviherbaspirillum sp.]
MTKKTAEERSFDALRKRAEEINAQTQAQQEELRRNPPPFGVMTREPEQEIGERLREAREAKGLTQSQLAELTKRADKDHKGISRAVVSLYEAGTNRPGPKELRLLCESLRVTPSYLIYGNNDPFGGVNEYGRFAGEGRTEAEYYANMVYLFTKLHRHHSEALMKIMQDLLRPWEKGFDKKMQKEAFPQFLAMADKLRKELQERDKFE